MRILCVGVGGLGGYLSACLLRAGSSVSVVARGPHLTALQKNGLTLISANEPYQAPVAAFATAAQAVEHSDQPFDVVLLAVKMYDIAAVMAECGPALSHNGLVITLQNGVEAADLVAGVVDRQHVYPAAAYASAHVESPGVIRHMGPVGKLIFGPLSDQPTDTNEQTARAFAALCNQAGLDATLSRTIRRPLWEKFIFFSAVSGLCALTRQALGAVRDNPISATVLDHAISEAIAVARSQGAPLAETIKADTLATIAAKPDLLKPSLLVDLEKGRRLEVDWIAGTLHRLGAEKSIPTPTHSCIYAALTPFSKGKTATN